MYFQGYLLHMACPRCDRPLSVYTFQGREASVCESCGYVGVEVEHSSEPLIFESWDEAMDRFRSGLQKTLTDR